MLSTNVIIIFLQALVLRWYHFKILKGKTARYINKQNNKSNHKYLQKEVSLITEDVRLCVNRSLNDGVNHEHECDSYNLFNFTRNHLVPR